ncbi:hypothetical protein Tco_1320241 [Tanacetum coccineum]
MLSCKTATLKQGDYDTHISTFNQYKDAKTLFEAIEATFGGNEATKRKTKHDTPEADMYEKLQGFLAQYLNFKFLRSLPSEWSMHVMVWRNKPDLGSISFDDLYNNFKIVEQEEDLENNHEDDLEECILKGLLAIITIDELDVIGSFLTEEGKPLPTLLLWHSLIQRIELNKSEFDLANYKRGLASMEEQLVFYKKNKGYEVKVNKSVCENSSNEIKKTSGAPIIEDWVSGCGEDETIEKVSESADIQTPKQADQPRKNGTKLVLNNVKKGTGQREVRTVWNNAMRTNHQNFSNTRRNFAPTTVLTKSGLVPISAARQNSSRTAATVSAARPIKTVTPKPFVNVAKTRPNAFQKSHSPSRRPFYQQTTLKNRNLNNKVNTVKANSVNAAKGKRVTSAVGEQRIDAIKQSQVSNGLGEDIDDRMNILSVLVVYHTTNGHQFTMSNRHQELASPEQTVSGKDFSNLLIVDSLLKTIWFINAPCFCNKALAIPGQMTTGKELSNPLIADSLPKTILSTMFLG